MITHYTYITRSSDGRYYIGVRSCEGDPAQDPYMGSHTDETYVPNRKRVLTTFDSREEALSHEIYLHEVRDVARNPRYANRARATSVSFDCQGVPYTDERKKRLSEERLGGGNPFYGHHHTDENRQLYSETRVGEGNSFYGRTHSEEFKRRHSERMKERMRGESNPFYGKTHTPEAVEKIRQKNLGKTISEEHKRAISEFNRKRWEDPERRREMTEKMRGRIGPMKGKSHSEESRRKMSEERRGKKWFHDPETKQNILRHPSDCPPGHLPGKWLTDDQRRALSERTRGTKASNESRRKRSAALKGRRKTEEHAARIGDALRGKKKSKEHTQKTAEAQRGFKWFHHPKSGIRTRCLPENCPSGYVPGRG